MRRHTHYLTMLVFLVAAATLMTYLTRASEREMTPKRQSFAAFPETIGKWKRVETQTLDDRVLEQLKPDDYLSATYADEQNRPVYLFIGYYESQRHGKTYHSPQNCLPGAGWMITRRGRYALDAAVPGLIGSGEINDFTISKEDGKLLTLYWYQGRGRVVASEYWGKFYSVEDAVFRRRTDGSLVRVMLPVVGDAEAEQKAQADGRAFVKELIPQLSNFIPN
jgi:EpsI family protein